MIVFENGVFGTKIVVYIHLITSLKSHLRKREKNKEDLFTKKYMLHIHIGFYSLFNILMKL